MDRENPGGFVSDLRAAGHAVLPAPRQVERTGEEIYVNPYEWGLILDGVEPNDIAVRRLLDKDEGFDLALAQEKRKPFELAVRPGAVVTGTNDGRNDQAYRIEVTETRIAVTANAHAGLFYGVQTLLQLGNVLLPACTIVDWPEYELRCIHWDTKHHQDRPETLRRFLDEAARFKINAVLFELEDKFEYPSHPVVGAPGAFTTKELQDLVDYALERHIQIIPDVQGPAHMAYVLKHEEFAHLRCDGSNYQICMDEPEARKLLFDLYDDVCEATRGVRYFHVSTDEVYYAGICEKFRKPYNPENRSLTWVDYVNAAHEHLAKKGRNVIVWGEYPLLPEHVTLLPKDLLNGVGGRNEPQTTCENEHGIRQFCYVSMQGVELLFPNYFGWTDARGRLQPGRIENAVAEIARAKEKIPHAIGMISAAWDDSGLHNETFWLGWAMTGQAAWTPGLDVEEAVASFLDIFYGPGGDDLAEIYRDLQAGARFYEQSLERLPSKVRGPAYGDWDRKAPVPRKDRTLAPPALPDPETLAFEPAFRPRYEAVLAAAPRELLRNDRLLLRIQANLARVERNRYNLEVFLSIARFQRQFIRTVLGLAEAEDHLAEAARAAAEKNAEEAVRRMAEARDGVLRLVADLYATYDRLKATWEKSRFEKGRSVGGRRFVHVMDDVKDHSADRRPDLSYLIEPYELMDLPGWADRLQGILDTYAAAHGVAIAAPETARPDD